jgi:hypothetical protein
MTTAVNNYKLDFPFTATIAQKMQKIVKWREVKSGETQSFIGKIGRRVCCGAALALLSIASAVESIASFALAILSIPFALAGYKFSEDLMNRGKGAGSLTALSLAFLVTNIYADRIGYFLEAKKNNN